MPEEIRIFKSPDSKAEYFAAYDEMLKLWPVSYEELYIPTRFGDTHVIASGSKYAAPLVLFHPAGCPATIWYRNVEALSQHYRIYAVDVMGEVNKSTPTRRIDSRQELADWIEDLFNGLNIQSTDIVGNSFGGFLTLNTVLLLPARVKKAVLISPAATFAPMWPWWWYFLPAYGTGSKRLLRRAYDWIWQDFRADQCITQLRNITSLNGIPKHISPSIFADRELRKISTPILLLIGDHEVIYNPQRVIQRASRLVTNLRAEIVLHANHNAEYTNAEVVNEKILKFLEGVKP